MNPFLRLILTTLAKYLWYTLAGVIAFMITIEVNNMPVTNILTFLVLFTLALATVWLFFIDAKRGRVSVKTKRTPVAKAKPVKLELAYPSTLGNDTLHMPVKDVFHAQEMVDVLGLKEASLGYRRSADGKSIVLYSLDDTRTLRRVLEVV